MEQSSSPDPAYAPAQDRTRRRLRLASNDPIARPPDPLSRTVLVLGAGRRAGQSLLALALCRWLQSQGARVAPFRACAARRECVPTIDGGFVARDQHAQALACEVEPVSQMSPVLWPHQGRTATDAEGAARAALQSYLHLAGGFDIVVAEASLRTASGRTVADPFGGISPWWHQGPILLVADTRGRDPQTQLAATIRRLRPEDRRRLCGVVLNRTGTNGIVLSGILHAVESRFALPVWGGLAQDEILSGAPPVQAIGGARGPVGNWASLAWRRWCDHLAMRLEQGVHLDWLAHRLPVRQVGEAPAAASGGDLVQIRKWTSSEPSCEGSDVLGPGKPGAAAR